MRTALFAALAIVCAQLSVTLPISAVPFTFQVFAVLLAGALLGPRLGALSIALYLALGAAGLPVFSQFSGGLGVLFGPTGGYLFGFVAAAFVVGLMARPEGRPGPVQTVAAMLAGVLVIYVVGVAGLMLYFAAGGSPMPLTRAIAVGVAPFILFDLFKALVAGLIAQRVNIALQARQAAYHAGRYN